jgi:ABC-type antimicrobial peptide transport system permease subunit
MVRVYIHEALVLVLAASIMGILIGTATAWSFTLQRTLFLNTPLQVRPQLLRSRPWAVPACWSTPPPPSMPMHVFSVLSSIFA